jgi:hypothetical protein
MFPVFDPLEQRQEFAVLLIALVGIPGEGAENGNAHKDIGKQRQHKIHNGNPDKQGQQAHANTNPQNGAVELIRAVTACHKVPQSGSKFLTHTAEPATGVFHRRSPLKKDYLYYISIPRDFNRKKPKLTVCSQAPPKQDCTASFSNPEGRRFRSAGQKYPESFPPQPFAHCTKGGISAII